LSIFSKLVGGLESCCVLMSYQVGAATYLRTTKA
jgi:hypothetical protein